MWYKYFPGINLGNIMFHVINPLYDINSTIRLLLPVYVSGRPEPAQNCTITNISMTSLAVKCAEGFNGGLVQSFMLEVREMHSQVRKCFVCIRLTMCVDRVCQKPSK